MKKIAIALSALAGIVFLSGCAYDNYDRYAYDTGFSRYDYGWDYGYRAPIHHYYMLGGARFDCFDSFDARFCG